MKNLVGGVESVYETGVSEREREREERRERKSLKREKGRCPAPSRTRTLSFHTDRDRPRLHFRVQAIPAPRANLYIPMRNEMDPMLVYIEWIKVRQLGEASASYCYIWPNINGARYCRQFLALRNYASTMGSAKGRCCCFVIDLSITIY